MKPPAPAPVTETRPRRAGRPGSPESPGAAVPAPHAAFPAAAAEQAPAATGLGLLACRELKKSYHKGKLSVPVLRGVDLDIHEGSFTAIVGQSGSGKSTLLHLLATLDSPDEGQVLFDQQRIDQLPAAQRDRVRNQQFGMIFQFYHLLPELSALENVLTPCMIAQGWWSYLRNRAQFRARAEELLTMVGLGHRMTHKPKEMSGGEMQRTAIARALVARPRVLLADEPTGNLDLKTGREILSILRTLNESEKLTIVMVTHDQAIAEQADHTVRLREGLVD